MATLPRPALARAAALLLLAALGCNAGGGDGNTPAEGGARDTAAPVNPAPTPDTSSAATPSAPRDTGAAGSPTAPDSGGGAAPSAPVAPPPSSPAPDTTFPPESWAERSVSRPAPAGQAILTAARAARHGRFDRFVLEFQAGPLPGYTIHYAAGRPRECGSGAPVEMPGAAALVIELRQAAAHDSTGVATVRDRERAPRLPVIKAARLTCDFEGEVAWVLGLAARRPFRAFTLEDPGRIVVDVLRR